MKKMSGRLIIAMLAALALVLLWGETKSLLLEPAPVSQDNGGWSLHFEEHGATSTFDVSFDVDSSSGAPIAWSDRSFTAGSAEDGDPLLIVSGPGDLHCEAADDAAGPAASWSCDHRLTIGPDGATLNVDIADPAVTVGQPDIEVVKLVRHAPFPPGLLIDFFLVLVAFAPVIWLTHRSRVLSQWLILGLAAAFLGYAQPLFTLPVLVIVLAYFVFGKSVYWQTHKTARLALVWVALTAAILLTLKNFKALFALPFEEFGALAFILPLGTSYFLIRLIDLQIRFYKGELQDLSLREYLVYIFFPPTIVAGPIELIDKFRAGRPDRLTVDFVSYGFMRIAVGLFKKLIVADLLLSSLLFDSGLWNLVLTDPVAAGPSVIFFCILLFVLGYVDFSAYSDIAIGLARIYGYRICENFNWPILAASLNEFWQRWHMSLSSWCFRNIFFPTFIATQNRVLPLLVTFLVVGLWHDLGLSWITWGLYHGVGLAFLAVYGKKGKKPKWRLVAGSIFNNLYVAAGFSFITIESYTLAWKIFAAFWIELAMLIPNLLIG